MLKKKLTGLILATAMTATALSGCSPDNAGTNENPNESQGSGGGEVTIRLGIWPEDTLTSDIKMHEGYVEKMKELHPEVTVVPAYYKYSTDTFMPMVESGNCPTVFETWFTEPQKLIKAGAVADITDILKERGWFDQMNPSIRQLLSDSEGRVYGIPRDGYALSLMLNVEVFEEAGLVDADGYPIYPKTWEELAETAKTITEKTDSAGFCLLAKDNNGGWHFSNIAWGFGATLCTDNGDGTFTSHLDSPEAIKAMEYVKSLKWEYNVLTAAPTNEDWATGFTQIATGGAAMYIGGSDAVNQPTQVNGMDLDKFAMAPVPAGDAGQFSLYGGVPYMFSAKATKEEINAALDYLELMGRTPELTEESLEGIRKGSMKNAQDGIPVLKPFPCWTNEEYVAAQEAAVEEFKNVDAKLFDDFYEAISGSGLHLEEPGETQSMYAELTNVIQAVLTDENADVAALMKTANDNYQKILDDAA